MSDSIIILIGENQVRDADLARSELEKVLKSCQFQRVETQAEFLQALTDFQPNLILSSNFLPSFNEMQVLEQTAIHAPLIPVIMRIESPNKDKAVEYLKAESSNCIPKGKFKR